MTRRSLDVAGAGMGAHAAPRPIFQFFSNVEPEGEPAYSDAVPELLSSGLLGPVTLLGET